MIIITGIGRSGTSFTAKVLCETGTKFKGDWFDEKIKAGMEYGKVTEVNNMLMKGLARSLDEAISELGVPEIKSELSEGVIVKDPRFTMTLDKWLAAGFNIEHIIYCARDYREIYDSSMRSGCGMGGDLVSGVTIPSFDGFRIFFTYVERMFYNSAENSGIPVTTVYFPDSVKDFAEIEKLAFLADRERLRSAWEKSRRPDMVGSKADQLSETDDSQMLVEAYRKLNLKEQEIIKLTLKAARLDAIVAELQGRLAELQLGPDPQACLSKKLERSFRRKLLYPFLEMIGLRNARQ